MEKKADYLFDFNRLFSLLRGAARVGYNYTLIITDSSVYLGFHGHYLDDGFEDFKNELLGLSIFKNSSIDNNYLCFSNPYNQ